MKPPPHPIRRFGLLLLLVAILLASGGVARWALEEVGESEGRTVPGSPVEREDVARETASEEPELHGTPDATSAPEIRGAPPPTPWHLSFDVVDEDGTPHPWRRAEFHDPEGSVLLQRLAEDGSQTSGELSATGSGHLVVWSDARVPWVSEGLAAPPSGARHLTVRLEAGRVLAGEVFEQDGVTPLARGTVQVRCPATREPYRPALGRVEGLVTKGRFRIEGLPTGPATVVAKAYDLLPGRAVRIETETGREDLRLVLAPEGAISFLIVDRSTGRAPKTKHLEIRILEEDGIERGWIVASTTDPGEPNAPSPTGNYFGTPGCSYRFRVRAQGYEESDVITVTVPRTGGRLTRRVELDPDPRSVARLTLRVRTLDPPLPKFVMVTRHSPGGSSTGHGMPHEDGRVLVELPPGVHRLSVGGGVAPQPGKVFWLDTPLDIELHRDEDREVEVWIRKGGWVFLAGDPDPRPDRVVFRQGDASVVQDGRWTSWQDETGYFLGPLPPGRWKLEYAGRRKGARGAVVVRKGEVTRLSAATLESFEVEDDS